jgi:RNA polymerase sigma-70 factor (ECF subfamily)
MSAVDGTEGTAMQDALTLPGARDAEAELVERAKASDRAAWEEIFDRHYQRVFVFVFCRVGDRIATEDLVADVFVEAWRGMRRFEYRGVPLIAWLYRIAHNLSADFLKKRNRVQMQTLEDGWSGVPHSEDQSEQVAAWQAVTTAFRKLTGEQQMVLVCRFFEGLTLAETAAMLGKKENAIKALEFRALRSVRKILGNQEGVVSRRWRQ